MIQMKNRKNQKIDRKTSPVPNMAMLLASRLPSMDHGHDSCLTLFEGLLGVVGHLA